MSYAYLYFQSNLLEILILIFYFKIISKRELILNVSACNAFTHPIVVFFFLGSSFNYITGILLGELFAFVMEGLLYKNLFALSARRAFLGSLFANFVSWQFGPVLTYLVINF